MTSRDAIIVGGGLIGCSIARALAGEGLRVLVLERGPLGSGASSAAAGMLAPQAEIEQDGPFLNLCLESRGLFPALSDELRAEVGEDVRYRAEGSLLVGFGDEQRARLKRAATIHRSLGLTAEFVEPDHARDLETVLTSLLSAALVIPGDHQVDNRRLTDAVIASCRARGVEFREHCPVSALARSATGRIDGVATSSGSVSADVVIVAAGCWSGSVEGFSIPIEPVKGQMLAFDFPAPPFSRILRSERCYLVPRLDGRVLVGATMEWVGFDREVSDANTRELSEAAREIAPSLEWLRPAEVWTGLRPATHDHIPAVGKLEEGLIAATGHFRNGILLAPITARIVCDLVLDRPPHPALGILDPRRFLHVGTAGPSA